MSKGRFLLALVAVGSALLFWRRRQRSSERADLYYANGSMISLEAESAEGAGLFPLAADVVGAAKQSEA